MPPGSIIVISYSGGSQSHSWPFTGHRLYYNLRGDCNKHNEAMLASSSGRLFKICAPPYQSTEKGKEKRLETWIGYAPVRLKLKWLSATANAKAFSRHSYVNLRRSLQMQHDGWRGSAVDNSEQGFGSKIVITRREGFENHIRSTLGGTGPQDVEDHRKKLAAVHTDSNACHYSSLEEITSLFFGEFSNEEQRVQDDECINASSDLYAASVESSHNAFGTRKKERILFGKTQSSSDGKESSSEQTITNKAVSIHSFRRKYVSSSGSLIVQVMRKDHLKATEELLVDSFAESMWGLLVYRPLLAITVRGYLCEKFKLFPNTVTLVGFYAPAEDNTITGSHINSVLSNWVLAGTVEVSFSHADKVSAVPTPSPPIGFPYLCNMAVDKRFRRRGIGWQLLMAAEELAAKNGYTQMYLHCRVIDSAPLQMYKKAWYKIILTDSIWILLLFQRRRHLMAKSFRDRS